MSRRNESVSTINEQERWEESVRQIENTDVVQGGEQGVVNIQAKALANRTTYLKKELEKLQAAHDKLKQSATNQTAIRSLQQKDESQQGEINQLKVQVQTHTQSIATAQSTAATAKSTAESAKSTAQSVQGNIRSLNENYSQLNQEVQSLKSRPSRSHTHISTPNPLITHVIRGNGNLTAVKGVNIDGEPTNKFIVTAQTFAVAAEDYDQHPTNPFQNERGTLRLNPSLVKERSIEANKLSITTLSTITPQLGMVTSGTLRNAHSYQGTLHSPTIEGGVIKNARLENCTFVPEIRSRGRGREEVRPAAPHSALGKLKFIITNETKSYPLPEHGLDIHSLAQVGGNTWYKARCAFTYTQSPHATLLDYTVTSSNTFNVESLHKGLDVTFNPAPLKEAFSSEKGFARTFSHYLKAIQELKVTSSHGTLERFIDGRVIIPANTKGL